MFFVLIHLGSLILGGNTIHVNAILFTLQGYLPTKNLSLTELEPDFPESLQEDVTLALDLPPACLAQFYQES